MAAQSLRSRRHPRRTHGIHPHTKTLLLGIYWPAPETMTCPLSRSRFRWLRRICALVCAIAGCCSLPASRAQNINLDKPLQSIDEDITGFAYAPDGRIIYSVRRLFKTKLYDLHRHDIWLPESNGKRRRLLGGEKFIRGDAPFTYTVR